MAKFEIISASWSRMESSYFRQVAWQGPICLFVALLGSRIQAAVSDKVS